MTLYRIYAKMIASRRYQVTYSDPIFRKFFADAYKAKDTLCLLSPRPYHNGCIINPSTVIRELIAARREA